MEKEVWSLILPVIKKLALSFTLLLLYWVWLLYISTSGKRYGFCILVEKAWCVRFLSVWLKFLSVPACSAAPLLSSALLLKSIFPPMVVFPPSSMQCKCSFSSLKFNHFHLSSNYRTLSCVWRLFVEPLLFSHCEINFNPLQHCTHPGHIPPLNIYCQNLRDFTIAIACTHTPIRAHT